MVEKQKVLSTCTLCYQTQSIPFVKAVSFQEEDTQFLLHYYLE